MTTLIRWEPFREAAAVHNELSRLMNGLHEGNGRSTQTWVPALDAWETDDELVYAFDLPGLVQDKISVEIEDGTLTVSAERMRSEEVSQERYHRFERRFGSFARTVGVLEIRVAKPEQVKPKKIEIGFDTGAKTIEGTARAA
jgi:HSP20 family protein